MRHQIFLFNEKYSSHSNQSLSTQHFERFINWRLVEQAQRQNIQIEREKNKEKGGEEGTCKRKLGFY